MKLFAKRCKFGRKLPDQAGWRGRYVVKGEMMEQTRENKMGSMPLGKLIITMSLPIMISMLVQALYNVVDSIFVAMINEDGKEIDVKTLEEEEDKEGAPLSIEEIDNVSMVKPKESVEVITEKESENDSESEDHVFITASSVLKDRLVRDNEYLPFATTILNKQKYYYYN